MQNISVVPNEYKDPDLTATAEVVKTLKSYGKSVFMEDKFKERLLFDFINYMPRDIMLENSDLVVVLGGDGTILDIAASTSVYNVPIVGINFGNLGFLSQAEKGDNSIFKHIFAGDYSISKSMMIDARIMKDGSEIVNFTALNDVVIRSEYSRMINVKISVDGIDTSAYTADGVIVATATGSTAYSLSAGGPIVHPDVDAMIITPICPHSLKSRCIVIPGGRTVRVDIMPPYRLDAVVTIDGKKVHVLEENEYVEVTKSSFRTTLLNMSDRSFFDLLREKLEDR